MMYAIKRKQENHYLSRRSWWDAKLTADSVYDGHEVVERIAEYDRAANRGNGNTVGRDRGILAETEVQIISVVERVVEQVSYMEAL